MIYDLIIIGGGPAGYRAAERAGAAGLAVLLMEKREVGGVCLNEGCIPTKTYLYSAKIKDNAEHGSKYGVSAQGLSLDHKAVLQRKKKVVSKLVGGVKAQLKQAGVTVIKGEALITGRNGDFEVMCGGEKYTAKQLLIATGSSTAVPPIPGLKEGLESGFVVTNREILDLDAVPQKLAVIGGGVIGLEMASYFTSAGSKVTVIEMLDSIGGPIDSDMASLLKKNLENKGITFLLSCKVTGVKKNAVTVEDKSGAKEIEADLVLLSAGRKASTLNLGLENIGVLTERGAIVTDESMKTNVPGVFAAGDVNGKSMLAHTAYREAEVAINVMLGKEDAMDYRAIPGVIYTTPEVAGVGETEKSAKDKGLDVSVKTISMNFAGRYVAENENGDGIAKILTDKKHGRVVGFHMTGSYASEIIYGACMMIGREMTPEQIEKTVFPHPTVSEIIKEILS